MRDFSFGKESDKCQRTVTCFLINLAIPPVRTTTGSNDDFELLELSTWHNSSTSWQTPYAAFEVGVTQSVDNSNELYIVGGYKSLQQVWRKIQRLDLADKNNRWIELKNVTIPAHLGATHMAVLVHSRRLYILTGQLSYGCGPATRACAYLDLSTHKWVNLPDLPEALYSPQAIISNNLIHLFAGVKSDRFTPALRYWILNLNRLDQGWFEGPVMPDSGDHGQSVLLDGWMYMFAFEHGHSVLQINHTGLWDGHQPVICLGKYIAKSSVFKIDSKQITSSGQWIRLADMPRPVSHATSLVLNSNLILLFGGMGPVGNERVSHIQMFDSRLNEWRLLTPLPGNATSPYVWTNQEQSILYTQMCHWSPHCTNQQAYTIWAHKPKIEKCLFYPDINCTTRKIESTPYVERRRISELKWDTLFSQTYLINMPKAVERLRRTWYELNKIDLTSITLFEGFQINDVKKSPILIREDLLLFNEINRWQAKNNTEAFVNHIRSMASVKLILMNLWTKNANQAANRRPVLVVEDDITFIRSRDETFEIVEKTMTFFKEHTDVRWDLIYLGYRDMEATRIYEISQQPLISLWRSSHVLSNTGFIVNTDPRTIESLNRCCLNRLVAVDEAISYCVKHQLINAYLIEPKLIEVLPGFSFTSGLYIDYAEINRIRHTLSNHT